MPPPWANFVFLVETGFLHVGKAGLEFLTSGYPPALASQSSGFTGMSHDSPTAASQVARITGAHQHVWLIFVFLLVLRFHHIGHAGLQLLASSDLPALASVNSGITGTSHRP